MGRIHLYGIGVEPGPAVAGRTIFILILLFEPAAQRWEKGDETVQPVRRRYNLGLQAIVASSPTAPLHLRPDADLHDAVGRQPEELGRVVGVAVHQHEQPLAPDRHARPVGGQQPLAAEEIGRLARL